MARKNLKPGKIYTEEGGTAKHINPELQLRRSVMACMLWEKTFYEEGESVADRILQTVPKVDAQKVSDMAIEARTKMKLRHVPLLLTRAMASLKSHKGLVAKTLEGVIQRADELSEFLAIYWDGKKTPLSAQVKKGLAKAFRKFDEYALAKYNRDGAVKLRDVLFMSHAKPQNEAQAALWKRLVDGTLTPPDTWEVASSAGKEDKKDMWERLMSEKKLGGFAFLRNLRNMHQANVDEDKIREYFEHANVSRILPFRFIAAAQAAPDWEENLEKLMRKNTQNLPKLPGKTVLLVDNSGSMEGGYGERTTMAPIDAACGLAMIARDMCEECKVYVFSDNCKKVPARHGFALRDAIKAAMTPAGTNFGAAIQYVAKEEKTYDRIIIVSDEQAHDEVGDPIKGAKGYCINVAAYENGVGYGRWNHMDGFSEAALEYIREVEKLD